MTLTRLVSATLVAALATAALPAPAAAASGDVDRPAATSPALGPSIDRAAARLASTATPRELSPATFTARETTGAMMQGGGGGGGHLGLILTLVGTAASIGASYYVVKQMRKQTDTLKQ